MKKFLFVLVLVPALGIGASLSAIAKGGKPSPRDNPTTPLGVSVAPGYFMEAVVEGLNFPTAIAWNEEQMWVSEAGIAGTTPGVMHIDMSNGNASAILTPADLPAGMLLPPVTDVTYHDGWLWMTHLQLGVNGWSVGAISKFRPEDSAATFTTVITDLPASGDHHVNEIIFAKDGRGYFSQGTATNMSVVGIDNLLITGWLGKFPQFHDFPAKDIVLNGKEFVTKNPLTADPDDLAVTPPFHPFGYGEIPEGTMVQAAEPGNPQNGVIIGNGAVYSFDPSTADPVASIQLESWGLRNPYGIGLDPYNPGLLFVANNGGDIRGVAGEANLPIEEFKVLGSRPIANDLDDMFQINIGGQEEFFGWPDFFHHPQTGEVLPVTDPLFCENPLADIDCPDFVFDQTFRESLDVAPAFAQFTDHSSANKFDFSSSKKFKHQGDIFVAETGSFAPITGTVQFTGYKVSRVNRQTGQVSDFIVNTGNTAEEIFNPDSFNKPIDVKFAGPIMLIVDFGIFEPGLDLVQPGTGKIWAVSHGRSGMKRFSSDD